jgi:ribosome-binding protein aMBF1 (putative translation factor)
VIGGFTIEYVELPNGRMPAREFVNSLDDQAAARIDAFIERLRVYGNRMQGKFGQEAHGRNIRATCQTVRPDFSSSLFLPAGNADRDYVGVSEENARDSTGGDHEGRAAKEALDEAPKSLHGIAKETRSYPEGVGLMKQSTKRDRHSEIVDQRARKSATYRKTFERTMHQIDLALLVREMREDAGLTQTELAKEVGTTQSVIARLEDAEYTGHSLTMLERIATACGVALKLHAEKKPHFDREVALV